MKWLRVLNISLIALTVLFIGFTALCGFSLKASFATLTMEGINFHIFLATTTIAITLVTITVLALSLRINKK